MINARDSGEGGFFLGWEDLEGEDFEVRYIGNIIYKREFSSKGKK